MDTLLLLLALTTNAVDAKLTCDGLRAGTLRERNVLMGGDHATCGRVVAVKTAYLLAVPVFKAGRYRTAYIAGMAGSGAIGVAITLRAK